MRWCCQIGRSFRYYLVSGQQSPLTSCVFHKIPPRKHLTIMATTVDFTFLLALFVFLAVFSNRRSKIGPIWCWNFPLVEKTSENSGISIFGRLLGFANTLCTQAFLVLLCAVSLVKNEQNMTSRQFHQSDDICKAESAKETGQTETHDKQGCIY